MTPPLASHHMMTMTLYNFGSRIHPIRMGRDFSIDRNFFTENFSCACLFYFAFISIKIIKISRITRKFYSLFQNLWNRESQLRTLKEGATKKVSHSTTNVEQMLQKSLNIYCRFEWTFPKIWKVDDCIVRIEFSPVVEIDTNKVYIIRQETT